MQVFCVTPAARRSIIVLTKTTMNCGRAMPTVYHHTKISNAFSHLSIYWPEGDTHFPLLMTVLHYARLAVVMDSCPAQMLTLPAGRLMEQPQRCFSFIDLHCNTIITVY
jgi:hypothetical protein